MESTLAPHLLTDEQVASFDRDGYLVLRDRVPADLLERLQRASDRWIADGQASARAAGDDPDYNFARRGERDVLFRVNYLHAKGEDASLELLGDPAILGIAASLAGDSFVPTYESLVFKAAGDGAPIEWHQDAVHPRTHRIFNIDVYLDASRIGNGALRVAPGSQRRPVDICALRDEYGWDAPGVVQVEMEPGDVLVHDVMIVHGSEPTSGGDLRRTVYYEFRAAEQIVDEGPWDAGWIDRRMRLLPVALRAWAERHPGEQGFAWAPSERFRPAAGLDDAEELRIAHGVHSPGSYCSAGSVPAAEHRPAGALPRGDG
ncbi:phytanoyl-CoA dioxygenase family protein [Microbacterium hominis]|uniref:Phytanoyl-CoA dioxygenase family protein n=1 Tax=Microbacterium hominis TaxID=162426 RepID=A0A7D4UJ08_9MICO|nr:phytanoyl-CoA dioxygenase family protein [Microbacterium hominis]QKJ20568.1 phytanoyl-CoA dioxygenase family protein [Microbacterium hominis]